MKILAIDTSCDETAVAITHNTEIFSNVIWSQSSLHASFGGVIPSLAQRQHEERIGFVIDKALSTAHCSLFTIDCIAVTIGPGLGIALGVGIKKAKELAIKYNKPLIPISHSEAHLLSPFANYTAEIKFPMLGLVLSGGTTVLCLVRNIGNYEVLAETSDDALGEALDKGARLLGLGYPGGAILEKFARNGDPKKYKLPLPLQNDKIKNRFSYSGLKTAFMRLFNSVSNPTKQDIADLAASFQSVALDHILKVLEFQIVNCKLKINNQLRCENLLLGGGVANNIEIKKRLRKLCKKYGIKLLIPYTKKLNGDNAAMVGVTAYLKIKGQGLKVKNYMNYNIVDRNPRLKL